MIVEIYLVCQGYAFFTKLLLQSSKAQRGQWFLICIRQPCGTVTYKCFITTSNRFVILRIDGGRRCWWKNHTNYCNKEFVKYNFAWVNDLFFYHNFHMTVELLQNYACLPTPLLFKRQSFEIANFTFISQTSNVFRLQLNFSI